MLETNFNGSKILASIAFILMRKRREFSNLIDDVTGESFHTNA